MSEYIRHFVLETKDFGKFDVVEYKEYQKLENQLQQKENIIKEVREYIEKGIYSVDGSYVLKILDKGE